MLARWSYGSFVVIALLAVTAPGMSLVGTRLEPMVLGMPPAVAWSAFWVLASFVGLLIYDRTVQRERPSDDP